MEAVSGRMGLAARATLRVLLSMAMDASLWVSIILATITAVYAILTWSLARSSSAAAKSAAASARVAAESLTAQMATIAAEANRQHAWFKTSGGGPRTNYEILITPLLGAYVLRKVILHTVEFSRTPGNEDLPGRVVVADRELLPSRGSLPMLVDEVDSGWFAADIAGVAAAEGLGDEWRLIDWSCIVTFSLSEFSESSRRVLMHLRPDRDIRLKRLREARELGFF